MSSFNLPKTGESSASGAKSPYHKAPEVGEATHDDRTTCYQTVNEQLAEAPPELTLYGTTDNTAFSDKQLLKPEVLQKWETFSDDVIKFIASISSSDTSTGALDPKTGGKRKLQEIGLHAKAAFRRTFGKKEASKVLILDPASMSPEQPKPTADNVLVRRIRIHLHFVAGCEEGVRGMIMEQYYNSSIDCLQVLLDAGMVIPGAGTREVLERLFLGDPQSSRHQEYRQSPPDTIVGLRPSKHTTNVELRAVGEIKAHFTCDLKKLFVRPGSSRPEEIDDAMNHCGKIMGK
ncbi:hypothetical protein AA313_de0201329 [Arthrobotrys entomopaga]|nr:hypothetical protein AA313_de0201329 [Arthrobotrys entomopaga]